MCKLVPGRDEPSEGRLPHILPILHIHVWDNRQPLGFTSAGQFGILGEEVFTV